MKKYLAISLGPIYATITKARKTRELWIASYLFSSLMREIYKQLENKVEILSPLPAKAGIDHSPFGAGIFPDRLFAKAESLNPDELDRLIKKAIDNIAWDALPGTISKKQLTVKKGGQEIILNYNKAAHKGEAKKFWQSYFRIVKVWKDLDSGVDNILLKLNKYLDTAELQPVYFAEEPNTDFCLAMLDHPYKTGFVSALTDRGSYQKVMPSKSLFPSTVEIAAHELFMVDPVKTKRLLYSSDKEKLLEENKLEELSEEELQVDDQQLDEFYEAVFRDPVLKNRATDYHKYYCIVHVDGDNFGEVLEAMEGEKQQAKVHTFSTDLAAFAVTAAETIDKYGGKPIYIGGDDLLFFSPLRTEIEDENNQGKGSVVSLWNLIEALDDDFKKFTDKLNLPKGVKPTLSYGISITYYKYPLFEAHGISYAQLAYRAKKFKKGDHKKNAVAFRWLRHSGAYFEGVLTKEQFLGMKTILGMIDEIPGEFFSSIAFKLDTLSALVNGMVNTHTLTDERLKALFENFFNEPVHQNNRDGLFAIEGLMQTLFTGENVYIDEKLVDPTKNLYAVLRLLMFMTSTLEKNNLLNPVEHV